MRTKMSLGPLAHTSQEALKEASTRATDVLNVMKHSTLPAEGVIGDYPDLEATELNEQEAERAKLEKEKEKKVIEAVVETNINRYDSALLSTFSEIMTGVDTSKKKEE